jgi:integrase/recombinase XerD
MTPRLRPTPAAQADDRDPAVRDFIEYLQYEREASPNTVKAYANDLGAWGRFCAETGLKLYPVDGEGVARYMKRLTAEGMSSASRMRKAACLSAFMRFLMYDGRIDGGESLPPIPKREKTLPQVMTEGEIERLIGTCRGSDSVLDIRDGTIIEMAYDCGLRASELVSLKLKDVDDRSGVMFIRGKGRKERVVPFVGSLRETVRRYVSAARPSLASGGAPGDDGGLLFLTQKGRPMNRQQIWGIVLRRGTAAGISRARLHPHVLRHSIATHLQRRGMDLRTLQEKLGHASIATTEKYVHLDTELRDAYDSFHPLA